MTDSRINLIRGEGSLCMYSGGLIIVDSQSFIDPISPVTPTSSVHDLIPTFVLFPSLQSCVPLELPRPLPRLPPCFTGHKAVRG